MSFSSFCSVRSAQTSRDGGCNLVYISICSGTDFSFTIGVRSIRRPVVFIDSISIRNTFLYKIMSRTATGFVIQFSVLSIIGQIPQPPTGCPYCIVQYSTAFPPFPPAYSQLCVLCYFVIHSILLRKNYKKEDNFYKRGIILIHISMLRGKMIGFHKQVQLLLNSRIFQILCYRA